MFHPKGSCTAVPEKRIRIARSNSDEEAALLATRFHSLLLCFFASYSPLSLSKLTTTYLPSSSLPMVGIT